ncbi:PTS sugar transporter subunit IIA [Lentilactobacillus hilgardii]|uniref:PTS sugar transporter subunit IIA n=1 Tax=Lentilactobacillus hilgardii TaxID=1588 RepID=UPI0021C45D29|nr:PTS sugar transporter subunit IIA [Lentilactobacillus hilgardii]MCP9334415.1 PTS sugar transporter subunit IIA [Lentilactobacillus hilgardii]MCP9351002.1 PTS sugar transporter subunit IIA [Lentilactobacillus hilgardii]
MNIGIIITGHGNFATGIYSAVKLIIGPQESVESVDFSKEDTLTELSNNIDKAIADLNNTKKIFIMCDIFGGSPFNVAVRKKMDYKKIKIIYGVNLGFVIEFINRRNNNSLNSKSITEIEILAKDQMDFLNKK